ncbi:MAG TPA: hypothetical protein V6C76_16930 [Drouetiella sp.]
MVTWVGSSVGDYKIDKQLGEGNFSVVYHGNHEQTGSSCAFKVAKAQEDIGADKARTTAMPTKATATITGGIMDVKPLTGKLLEHQYAALSQSQDAGLVRVEELKARPELTYYEMEFLHGPSLRELMNAGPVSIEKMMDVARCLDKLSKNSDWKGHGDLKPENVMFTPSGVVLIDPGYFGRLDLENGSTLPECAVTTPAYYPTLELDDLFAFGLMLWEVVFGQQILNKRGYSEESDLSRTGPQLVELVKLQEAVGKYLLSPILDVQMPSTIHPGIDQNVERLLLKGLRINDSNGVLELDPGFRSFGAISGAFAAIRLKGKEHFLDA